MKSILNITLVISSLTLYAQNKKGKSDGKGFMGNWREINSGSKQSFEIEIISDKEVYRGSYCAFFDYGNKTDCSDNSKEYSFQFKKSSVNKKIAVFEFKTNFTEKIGIARLIIRKDTLKWEIIQKPSGEYYCPMKAILVR